MRSAMPSARAPSMRRHLERRRGRQRPRIAGRELVQERRLAHRLEHVEVVVAGGAVGAETDGHAGALHRDHRRRCRSPASCCSRDCATRRRAARPRIAMSAGVEPARACAASVRPPQKPIDSRNCVGVVLCFVLRDLDLVRGLGEVDDQRAPLRDRRARADRLQRRRVERVHRVRRDRRRRSGRPLPLPDERRRRGRGRRPASSRPATGNWMMVWPSTPRRPASFVAAAISSSK